MQRTYQHIYDELLVLRCQDHEAPALRELVARWQPRLWRFALHLTGEASAASDVLQDSWLAIIRGIGRLEDPARFRPWAYRIVSNKGADWVRRRQRDRRLADNISREEASAAERSPQAAEATANDHDDVAALRQAIRRLPDDRRVLLMMHYFEGMSVAEMATILNVPAGTVKSRLFHTRRNLKTLLERRSK